MPISPYLANKMLTHEFGSGAGFAPQSAFLSLHSANCSPTGQAEITGASSWRATAPNTTTIWSASGYSAWNITAIAFSTPNGNYGTAASAGIWDNASAGNFLYCGALGTATAIGSGNTVSFPSGSITISLT